ncbi:MAG: phosphotransferase [Candidatus Binatia bacterium]
MPEATTHQPLARAVRAAFGEGTGIVASRALAGDASNRRYVRLTLAGPGAPPTAVAMLLGRARFGAGGDELGGAAAPTELPFVNVGRWLAARGFPVPALYHDAAATDDLLLLEDIGDTTLWAAASTTPTATERLFGDAVDLLVALQAAGARHPDPACVAFTRRFDTGLARAELEHFLDHGIETRHGRRLPAAERTTLLTGLTPLVDVFATASPVLVHRDFMAWNLHVQAGRLRLIDFQDAFLGPEAYDLAALLTDRRTPELIGPAMAETLIGRFRHGRAAAGLPVAGNLEADYRLCVLHRALKVIGRFHFLECVQGKPGYLAYLPAVYAVARAAFDALPALAAVRERIGTHVPELATA